MFNILISNRCFAKTFNEKGTMTNLLSISSDLKLENNELN